MAADGASTDPKWIENELWMLEKTYTMYQAYASNAKKKDEKAAWDKRLKDVESRIEEKKHHLQKEKARRGLV